MPTRKPLDLAPDNLLLIIGQLLEATKAASDGLKSISLEVQSNAKAIIAASKTLERLEDEVSEIVELVSDATNRNNLSATAQDHATQLVALQAAVAAMRTTVAGLTAQVGSLDTANARLGSTKAVVWEAAKLIGWVVTTLVAGYAAVNGK